MVQQASHAGLLLLTSRCSLQNMRDIPTAFRELLTENGERLYCGVASGDNMRRAQVSKDKTLGGACDDDMQSCQSPATGQACHCFALVNSVSRLCMPFTEPGLVFCPCSVVLPRLSCREYLPCIGTAGCCAQEELQKAGLSLDTNKVLPYMIYSDGSQSNTTWKGGFKFHPVMISLPHHDISDGRKRFSVRRIGWLPALDQESLPFTEEYFETEE